MWPLNPGNVRRVLCLGAHSDDIEIGCGGTILRLAELVPDLEVCWVVFSAPGQRSSEAKNSAENFLGKNARHTVKIGAFRESYFPSEWASIKDWFEEIRTGFTPDLVLTHFRDDRHQDHRVISDLAWNTFRSHLVLEYEIPKYDGDLGRPNLYVNLPESVARNKVEILMQHFKTQQSKHWFTEDLFLGLMRIRGIEAASQYAEAFHSRKLVLA